MRNAFRIFRRDMGRLLRNPAALLVIIGVSIIPSLYAWFNIAANIDPYANTSGIKVAVANNDKDASSNDLEINAGDEIISNLKENDQLGWTFVDEEQAIEGVKSGEYYAAIVIPEDFSSSLLSILSGELKTPELEYYINEKANAIAPKITSSGASAIQSQINSTFSSIAAESVSDILKDAVSDVADSVGRVNSDINEMLEKANDNIKEYEDLLSNFGSHSIDTHDLIENAGHAANSLNKAAKSGSSALEDADQVMKKTRDAAGDFSSALSKSLSDGEQLLNKAHSTAAEGLTDLETKAGKINTTVGDALDAVNTVVDLNAEILNNLQDLSDKIGDEVDGEIAAGIIDRLNENLARLRDQNDRNKELVVNLTEGNEGIGDAITTTSDTRKQIASVTSDSIDGLHSFRTALDTNVLPQLNQTLDTFSSLTGELTGLLNGVPSTSEQLKAVLNQLDTSLSDVKSALTGTKSALASVSDRLDDIQSDVNAIISSEAYQKLLSLEGIDADTIASFMESPVELETETYFEVANYGSSMIPFYTNLAIWVGGIVLIAILKMEVDRDESMKYYKPSEMYMGRWLLFVVVGMVQGFIVCLGDIFLPGAQVVEPVRMVILGVVCSFVYVNIIYALSLTFKHIGKALCVILVILQIPGSSGTYPVEMAPVFFQNVHPFLPFAYGVGAMRECVAGLYGNTYIKDILILLLCYVPLSLLIGLGLRPALRGLNALFDKKLAETEFMICEEPDEELSRHEQLTMLLKASLSIENLREETAAKAQAFEKNYGKMVKAGFAAIIIIPLIFLILMFSLESKIVFLTLWIISIIAISVWLIVVEFIHNKLEEQQKISGMSFDEMLEKFRGKEEE